MALTMTRTRTQTTLTRLATQLARVNGELDFVRSIQPEAPEHAELLRVQEARLAQTRDALVLTLKQFDPLLSTGAVISSDDWRQAHTPKNGSRHAPAHLQRLVAPSKKY